MSKTDHLARAKDYIAKGEDYYRKAAQEIVAARDEGWTWPAIARELGRSKRWVTDIVAWATTSTGPGTPFGGETENTARYHRQAREALRDPERRRKAIAELPADALDDIAKDVTDVAVQRARAKRQEHARELTAGALMGSDKFDPSESWADTLIIRANRNVRELASHVERWGLVFGSMEQDEAFEYLQEAERLLAEVRVIAQERVRETVA